MSIEEYREWYDSIMKWRHRQDTASTVDAMTIL